MRVDAATHASPVTPALVRLQVDVHIPLLLRLAFLVRHRLPDSATSSKSFAGLLPALSTLDTSSQAEAQVVPPPASCTQPDGSEAASTGPSVPAESASSGEGQLTMPLLPLPVRLQAGLAAALCLLTNAQAVCSLLQLQTDLDDHSNALPAPHEQQQQQPVGQAATVPVLACSSQFLALQSKRLPPGEAAAVLLELAEVVLEVLCRDPQVGPGQSSLGCRLAKCCVQRQLDCSA